MKTCYSCFKQYDDGVNVCPHCGREEIKEATEPIYLMPGTMLAKRYIIGESVGAGGFGIIYKAWDTKLETIVAVKEFFVPRLVTRAARLCNVSVSKKSEEEFLYRKNRFLAEARNMARFGTHRSIPNVFEFFEENGTAYIVMELLSGMALNEYLGQNDNVLDVDFAIMIANEVGNALQSLHEVGIIHRDVAPDNIFICSGVDIKIKLLDLGAAKLADNEEGIIDIILKPGYSPTEQYDNSKNIGPWTDIYALGATLYMMLTGVKPDESTNRKIQDELVPPNELNPNISVNLSNAILKAMAIDRHMRFKSVKEFLAAINGERKVVSLAKERKRKAGRRAATIAGAATAVCAVGVLVVNYYNDKRAEEILNPADITVWYCEDEGSNERSAMEYMIQDFEDTFPGVHVELMGFSAEEYEVVLSEAVKANELPDLFESTNASDEILASARDVDEVIDSEQFKKALFLNQYDNYYGGSKKQMPIAIEAPVAYVITKGETSANFEGAYFMSLDELGTDAIVVDPDYKDLIAKNWDYTSSAAKDTFLTAENNTSAVMLSSTMALNEVREPLQNYSWTCAYLDDEEINCLYTYEWSLGDGSKDEKNAAGKLLSWMLGNKYQSILMISKNNQGEIPVHPECFESKIGNKYLTPLDEVKDKFVFNK